MHAAFRNYQPHHRVLMTYTAMHLDRHPDKLTEVLPKVQEFLGEHAQHVESLRHYQAEEANS